MVVSRSPTWNTTFWRKFKCLTAAYKLLPDLALCYFSHLNAVPGPPPSPGCWVSVSQLCQALLPRHHCPCCFLGPECSFFNSLYVHTVQSCTCVIIWLISSLSVMAPGLPSWSRNPHCLALGLTPHRVTWNIHRMNQWMGERTDEWVMGWLMGCATEVPWSERTQWARVHEGGQETEVKARTASQAMPKAVSRTTGNFWGIRSQGLT